MSKTVNTAIHAKNASLATMYMEIGELKPSQDSFNMQYLSNMLNLDTSEMEAILHLSRQNIHKMTRSKLYKPRTADTVDRLTTIVNCIVLVMLIAKVPETDRDQESLREKISRWFRIPNPAYDMHSPFDMIAQGRGNEVVRSLQDIFESSYT